MFCFLNFDIAKLERIIEICKRFSNFNTFLTLHTLLVTQLGFSFRSVNVKLLS